MRILAIVLAISLAGCAVGPNYQRPGIDLEPQFVSGGTSIGSAIATDAWWRDYNDPQLNQLISQGLSRSLDIRQATEAIREAEAVLRSTGVNAALSGPLTGQYTRSGGDQINGGISSRSVQLDASVVLDLFGGIRREREAAWAGLKAAGADVQAVRLEWLAELIRAYTDARFYQTARELTRESIAAREETVDIVHSQHDAGAATLYEVAEAEALLATARAALPQYAAQFNARIFAIATLIDQPATQVLPGMQATASQLSIPEEVASGVPADLLRNRPDVRSLEAGLIAAIARIGVAKAALYPSLALGGTIAWANSANSWSFGPSLSLPIFSQGALRAGVDAALSRARQAEVAWRAGVLKAIEDVQVAQSNLQHYRQRADALAEAADKYRQALSLAQENFRYGAITLLNLLETDRNAMDARISAASAANDAAQAWAVLKIATGAGAELAARID